MDRNGDSDVSLREFLGPIEHFRKLDRNGDGLISGRGADDDTTAVIAGGSRQLLPGAPGQAGLNSLLGASEATSIASPICLNKAAESV
jgi:hypothetical protein